MVDQARIIVQVWSQASLSDRDYYVIARSAGSFINIVLEPNQ